MFNNGTLTINDSRSMLHTCEGDQRNDCSVQLDATLGLTGKLEGTFEYQCAGIDEYGNPFNHETVQPAPFFAYRRPEAETSGNDILGVWDFTESLVETGTINGVPFGPLSDTLSDVWFFDADGKVTIIEFQSGEEDEEFFALPYDYNAETGSVTIEGTFMFSEDAGEEETCIIDINLTSNGDVITGSLDLDCWVAVFSGTASAMRRVVPNQNPGGEGPCASAYENATADQDGDGLSDCQECELGLNAESTDSDGDGMSDRFEVDFNLDPLRDDASDDLDGDGLTNLEEFLLGTDPSDIASPNNVFFVSTLGSDTPTGGSEATPWATLGYALRQVPASTANPVRINIFTGTYPENITLIPDATLAAVLANGVIIEGTVLGANDSALIDLEIAATTAKGTGPLLDLRNVAMSLQGVTFRGTPTHSETGIIVGGATLTESLIESCTFTSLGVGIDASGAIPVLRRSRFEFLGQAGIILRNTATGTALSAQTDAASGYNIFDIPSIDAGCLAIDNQSTEEFLMQENEWGTDDATQIEASVGCEDCFVPILAQGSALLASALFVVVTDATSQAPVTNSSITLTPSMLDPVTDNVDGVYAYPVLEANSYTVTISTPGFADVNADAVLSQGQLLTLPIGLPGPKTPGCYAGAHSSGPTAGDLFVVLAPLSLLIAWRSKCGQTDAQTSETTDDLELTPPESIIIVRLAQESAHNAPGNPRYNGLDRKPGNRNA